MSTTSQSLYPLQFQPLFRYYLWGGRGLKDYLGKPISDEGVWAESWEIVDHGPDQSIITNGFLAGKTLGSLLKTDPIGVLGEPSLSSARANSMPQAPPAFPLLLKYLDCHRVLSVQVHPDDAYAQKMTRPDLGKTEAWYVVQAEPTAIIYAGLRTGVTRESLAAAIAAGKTEECLHPVQARAGDCIFIPAGTVHALGSGLIVAEIQQSSDTTFRLFDWNRVDAQGNSRPLHVEEALSVIDFERGPVEPQSVQMRRPANGDSPRWDLLVDCEKFTLERFMGPGLQRWQSNNRFAILTIPEGSGQLSWSEGTLTLGRGDSVLVPAACTWFAWQASDPNSVVLLAQA